MIINLNEHSHFFASDQKEEEQKKPDVKNYGCGRLIQAPYLDEKNNHVLLLDFGNSTRFFVSIPDGQPGSFARVNDKFNITGYPENPTLIKATEVQPF